MKIGEILQKSALQFRTDNLTAKDLLPLYSRLKELGYDEETIYDRLGVKDREFVMSIYLPFYLRLRLKERTPLDRLIRLFMFAMPVGEMEIEEIFDRDLINLCIEVGLISHEGSNYKSGTDLFPCMGGIFATDHHFSPTFRKNHVYPLGYDSYMLARGIVPHPSRLTLDLCTGSGVQAITASRFSEKVIGVDLSPRALNFARFNALLNQAENVEFVKGNLYEPVKGEKFDLIVANPPFVPSPDLKLYFRDGGETGEDILKRIVEGVPRFLSEEGYAQIVTVMVYMKDSSYPEKLRGWLGEDTFALLTLTSKYIDVEPFILGHIGPDRDFGEYCDLVESWALNYEKNNIAKLVEGLINIKRSNKWKGASRDVHRMTGSFSGEVKNLLDIMEKQDDGDFIRSLGGKKFSLNPGINFFWEGRKPEIRKRYGVLFREDSLLVEDTELKEIHHDILRLIYEGKNTSEMLEEGLREEKGSGEIQGKEEIVELLAELLTRGIVETQG